jgi:TPP-dependent pyruvate/acetoin dehydrogenase alpha subunit
VPPPAIPDGFSLIPNQKLILLYSRLVMCRMIEERARILLKNRGLGRIPDAAPERWAAAVGVVIDLLPEDTLSTSPRDPIPQFIKGLPLQGVLAGLGGKRFPSPPAGARLRLALAAAQAHEEASNKNIATVWQGRANSSQASWHQSLRLAGERRLPIVFVSFSSRSGQLETRGQRPGKKEIALEARPFGFPAITVDGSDVVAVYRVASESIAHARRGNGPTLIQCVPWPSSGPSGAGHQDPILFMENYLRAKGLFTHELREEVANRFDRELDSAIPAA